MKSRNQNSLLTFVIRHQTIAVRTVATSRATYSLHGSAQVGQEE